jgi:hypothetical protein
MATLDAIPSPVGAFRQIGWAFLFLGLRIGLTFQLGTVAVVIDLLPDFVGYLMIATAANRLIVLDRRARLVRNLALVLTFLTIPMVVEIGAATPVPGGAATWAVTAGPLTAAQMVLDPVLVWILCGLVADLAGRAGDESTREKAVSRRVMYVVLRALVIAGPLVVFVLPNPALLLAMVVAVMVVGLILLTLMMGLFWRAEWMCQEWDEGPLAPEYPDQVRRPGGLGFRLLVLAAIALPLVLGALGVLYYIDWKQARDEASEAGTAAHQAPLAAFHADLLAGRTDDAYESTTADFKSRITRDQFGDLAARYVAFENRDKSADRGGGASAGSGNGYFTESHYSEVQPGKIVRTTITVRRDRDSLLFRNPPPLKVDDFQVEEGPAPERPGPLGGRPGPRR